MDLQKSLRIDTWGKKILSDSKLKFGLIQKEERIITSSKVLVHRY